MRPTKLFISYAHEDHDAARRLFKGLTEAGLEPWFDEESLLPGQKWRPAIQAAIREARYFVALLSSNSISKKGFVQKEISEALDVLDEYPESDIYLIPVRLDECTPSHSRLKDINWVDMFPDWARGFQKLLLAVGGTRDPETKIKTSLLIVLGDGYTGPIELTVYSHHKPETLVSPTMDDPFELPAAMRTKDKRRIYWVRGGRFLEDSKTYGEEGIREGDMLILTD
ncbi:MAG: toll/interleukin-1 receptor domain-containing protein, partial [Phycisphaerales bacterium]